MANSTLMRAFMLMTLLILSVLVSGQDKLHYGSGKTTMQKRIDSGAILRELGYDLRKVLKHSYRISMEDRKPPGGPDPQHNAASPGSR